MSISTYSGPACSTQPTTVDRGKAADVWIYPLIALGLAALVSLILLRSTAISMVKIWYGSSTYSYGFVVVPIVAFLVWRRRKELKTARPVTSVFGLALMLFFAVIWVVSDVADVQLTQQIAFIGLLEALVWTFLGRPAVRILRFPLLFLFFAVPAGESLVGPLQRFTAVFTVNALRLSGIPAVQDAFVISTPSGDWRIAEACSGIRYLTSSIVIGVLFAGVALRGWKRRLALVLISASVPILANALRAYLLILLAYFSNNRIAAGVDHVMYGWLFFSLVTAVMLGVVLRWREPEISPISRAEPPPGPSPRPQAPARISRLFGYTVVAVAIVLSATLTADVLWSRTPPNQPIQQFWSAPAEWLPAADPDQDWVPHFDSVKSEVSETFTSGASEVSLYIASYPVKRRGVELVNSANAVPESGEWDLLNNDYREVIMAGKAVRVDQYLLGRGGQHRLVWMWYMAGGRFTANPYWVKLIEAESRLAGHPQNIFLFAASASFTSQPARAVDDLGTFVRDLSAPR